MYAISSIPNRFTTDKTIKIVRWLFFADFHKAINFQTADQINNTIIHGFAMMYETAYSFNNCGFIYPIKFMPIKLFVVVLKISKIIAQINKLSLDLIINNFKQTLV